MSKANGPPPKRSTERRRRNAVPGETVVQRDSVVEVPRPPPGLHPIARRLYNSLAKSGQSEFYEPSDWELARMAAEITSRALSENHEYFFRHWKHCDSPKCKCEMPDGDINPKVMDVAWKLWAALMITEVERRRARVEVERPEPKSNDGPTKVDDYKLRLTK